jgi:hypothetical protein
MPAGGYVAHNVLYSTKLELCLMTLLDNRGRTSIWVALVLAGLLLGGLGFIIPLFWKSDRWNGTERNRSPASTGQAEIPAIDKDITVDLETATFALG